MKSIYAKNHEITKINAASCASDGSQNTIGAHSAPKIRKNFKFKIFENIIFP
jgi:hypothetical protein